MGKFFGSFRLVSERTSFGTLVEEMTSGGRRRTRRDTSE